MTTMLGVLTYVWVGVALLAVVAGLSNLFEALANQAVDASVLAAMILAADLRRDVLWLAGTLVVLVQALLTAALLGPLAQSGAGLRVSLRVAELLFTVLLAANLTQDRLGRSAILRESHRDA